MTATLDSLIGRLGNPGSYQGLVFVLLACNFFPIAFNQMAMVFYAQQPDFNCKMPGGWAWHRNSSIPIVVSNGVSKFESCLMYKDPENHALGNKKCIYGWQYHLTPPQWTIVTEWNLVCDRKYLVNVARLMFLGGCLLGSLTFGSLAEKFGRRNMMFVCLFGQTILGVGKFFVHTFLFFIAVHTIQGIFIQGLECISFVMIIELFLPGLRTVAGSSCFIFYSVGMIFLSLLGYSIQHWRFIQLAISLPSVITFSYIWLVPESLRFAIVSQKIDEVADILRKFARFSPTSGLADESVLDEAKCVCKHVDVESNLTYDVRDVFRGQILRRYTFFHCFCWFSAFLTYSSLTLFMPDLNSNIHLNFLLLGLVELLSHVIGLLAFKRFGRRRPLFILFIASGILSIASVLVDHLAKNRSEGTLKFSLTLAVLGKMCVTACVSGLFIFSAETFPTVIRTVGVGICTASKIIGGLVAPLVQLLGTHTLSAIPVILVGAVALVAAFVVLMLPETLKQPLPDVIAESEDLGKRKVISPIVDKASNAAGMKTASIANHPLTPPTVKRGAISVSMPRKEENQEKKDLQEKTEEDSQENEKCPSVLDEKTDKSEDGQPDGGNGSPINHVRFLGIDVMSDDSQQRSRKLSPTGSGAAVLMQPERRVRFSNVVQDIVGMTIALQNAVVSTAEPAVPSEKPDESSIDGTGEGTKTPMPTTDGAVVPVTPSMVSDGTIVLPPEMYSAFKPAFSILKKTSQDETGKKIVKSPHPVRKLSSNEKEETSEVVGACEDEVINGVEGDEGNTRDDGSVTFSEIRSIEDCEENSVIDACENEKNAAITKESELEKNTQQTIRLSNDPSMDKEFVEDYRDNCGRRRKDSVFLKDIPLQVYTV